jgi:uncharacterized protein
MLIEFKVKNFRSFKEEAVLSMVASADKSLPDNSSVMESFGNRRILHSAVIYGANAAGKTNLISAAAFVDKFVNTCAERQIDKPIDVQPFLLTEEPNNDPSEFEMTFIDNTGVRYQYGFHVNREKILREWLIAYPKGSPQTWFERELIQRDNSLYAWYFGRNLKGQNVQITDLCRPDVLFLSLAAKLNHKQLTSVFRWFQKSIRVFDATEMIPHFSYYFAKKAKESKKLQEEISRFLEIADVGIKGFDVDEKISTEIEFPEDMPNELVNYLSNQKNLQISMHHPIREGLEIPLPWEMESSGTRNIFRLSTPLNDVLKHGWTLFIDELDSSLHPNLVQYILKLFHSPRTNPKGAQIIFNTHDTTIMDQTLFRRDQIWFVEKDRKGCSHLYSLLEYSPRNKESLAKNYLQGRYGAIPFLGEWILDDKENENS